MHMNIAQKVETAIEQMSANAVNTRFLDLAPATVELAKNRIIDVIGCAIGGANAPGNSALIDLVKKWGGAEATIWIHGGKAPALRGEIGNAIDPPSGCKFHPRCEYAQDHCKIQAPGLIQSAAGHRVACLRSEDLFQVDSTQ
jgi:ABC-type antimicrobial peptide transport system ATPase subunit